MTRTCDICSFTFCPTAEYMKICFPCWKESKKYTLTKSDHALKDCQRQLTEVTQEVEALHERLLSLQSSLHRAASQQDSTGELAVTPEQIKKLIKLCHPDRHMGATRTIADEMTKWLLEQRENAR